jgi:hypothetical protein
MIKRADHVANSNWSVLKECVRGCDPSINHNLYIYRYTNYIFHNKLFWINGYISGQWEQYEAWKDRLKCMSG